MSVLFFFPFRTPDKYVGPDLVVSGRTHQANLGVRSHPVRTLICSVRSSPKICNLLSPYLLTVLLSMPFNKLPLLILGATTCTTLAFIMPGLCHYSLFRNELTKSQMCLDLFLAGFGILLAIVGTYDAVNKYNYPDPNHPHVPPIPIAKSHLVQTEAANSMNSIDS